MKTIKSLKKFSGIDTSNEISLFEYGLLTYQYQRSNKKRNISKNDIQVWFGVQKNEYGNYELFDYAWITEKEINDFLDESWFDQSGFLSFLGFELNEKDLWLNYHYTNKIMDLIQYYGYENIFGSIYSPILIEE